MQVQEIMNIKGTVLYTATPQQTLSSAVAAMAENDVGSLVVMASGKMVGMLTFREVINALHKSGGISELSVGDVMVKDPETAGPTMEADELRRLLIERRMRYLPVMDGTTLMGVVSFLDVARAVLEEKSFENRMLKSYIKNWPGEGES